MDSKAQKRIEVAKRKARAGESYENAFVVYLLLYVFFYVSVVLLLFISIWIWHFGE